MSILKNPAYAGTAYFHRYRTVEPGFTQRTQRFGKNPRQSPPHAFRLRPQGEWVAVDVPAIISAALFEQAQEPRSSCRKMGSLPNATAVATTS